MSPFSNVRMSPLAELPGADFHGWGTVGDERVGARAFARDAGAFEGAGVAAGGGGPAGLERSAGQALVASVAGEGRVEGGAKRSGRGSRSFCATSIPISERR